MKRFLLCAVLLTLCAGCSRRIATTPSDPEKAQKADAVAQSVELTLPPMGAR